MEHAGWLGTDRRHTPRPTSNQAIGDVGSLRSRPVDGGDYAPTFPTSTHKKQTQKRTIDVLPDSDIFTSYRLENGTRHDP